MGNLKFITTSGLTLSLLFGGQAVAGNNYDSRAYIAPSVSHVWLDEDRETSRNGYGVNLGLGKAISKYINLETKIFYNDYDGNLGQNDWDSFGLTGDIQYFFSRGTVAPYLVASAGFVDSRVDGKNAVGFVSEYGTGLVYKINENFSLRGDVRYRFNNNFNNNLVSNNSDEYNDMVVNVGFVIPFGDKKTAAPVAKAAPVAPQKPVVIAEKDSDFDGVKDSLDKCPGTPKNAKVNSEGCVLLANLVDTNFNAGSADLSKEAKAKLDILAKELVNLSPNKAIEVQGHASSEGSAKFNLNLSQKRADTVSNYLKSKNVSNKITSVGYGETKLLVKELTKADRSKNRRVEIIWK